MTTMLAVDGVQDWLSDASDDVLKRIAAGAVNANQWMMLKAIDQINSGLRINLGADWLQDVLGMMRYLVLPVVGLLFVFQVVTAMLARSPSGLWRAVWGSALGLFLGSACAVLTAGLLLIVDQFSNYLLGGAQAAAQDGIKKAFAMQGAIEGSGWLVVTLLAGFGILAWATIIIILFLRKAMIIATLVFAPFAMAGLAYGKTKSWAVKWVELVFALALSKFVVCVILTLAYSAVASSVTGDISDALLGSVWVLLAAFSPLAVLQFVHFASEQITAANTTGTAAALRNAGRGLGMTRHGTAALAGGAGAVGGWLAGKAASGGKANQPTSPASAVGGRPAVAAGAGAGKANVGGTVSGTGGSGSGTGSPLAGGDVSSPAAPSDVEPVGSSPAAATGSPVGESPDAVQWPRLQEHFNQVAQQGGHHPSVHPAGAAQTLGIPRSQAERMFLVAETQGLLGPQQVDGSRRLLTTTPASTPILTPTPGGSRA
ncbi:hypothetical protein [Nakamurella multipartita]|uniref:TrbL/VirB6 plasmid conjugal transfer protein n=1 Tax=Nakamurella multipartita (strain ATCC 700099 / DSM 44233 / CIP 104796 / JCM 9543 / NBRC 105858 / Y-104) TaxID=479431 RepID=C8X691_NAKMY|nr:hypothetical protein [Nakamurella multipartita]ACV76862.1 hypothetical protein Namu_0442 [Nakamurella multipartita DSM 44233]